MKGIYGLATAPLAFYNLCVDVFTKVGLQRLRTEESVFIKYVWNIKGKDSHINEAGEDVKVCRESLDTRVLALDVPHVLDEDALFRPRLETLRTSRSVRCP